MRALNDGNVMPQAGEIEVGEFLWSINFRLEQFCKSKILEFLMRLANQEGGTNISSLAIK